MRWRGEASTSRNSGIILLYDQVALALVTAVVVLICGLLQPHCIACLGDIASKNSKESLLGLIGGALVSFHLVP